MSKLGIFLPLCQTVVVGYNIKQLVVAIATINPEQIVESITLICINFTLAYLNTKYEMEKRQIGKGA